MKKNKTEEIEFIIDENNRVDFRQVLQMINMYEEKIQKKQAIIDAATETLEKGITFCENDSQGIYDKCNIAINREKEVLNILKKAQNEKN
jgi:hypothetical protein